VLREQYPNDGAVTDEFGRRVAELCNVEHGVAVSSGTAALVCALAACGVRTADEVLVPDVTFIATANAVRALGAEPVLVDVSTRHFGMDFDAARAAITSRTTAIVAVHVNGRAGELDKLVELARDAKLALVEDAAEALGSRHGGRPLGSFGDAACFSFAASKIITTGQGGAVVTREPEIAKRVRQMKDQGRAARGTGGADDHPVFGLNFKLTNIQAAIGLAQLERLPDRMRHIEQLRHWYAEELRGLEPVVALPDLDVGGGAALAWIDAVVEGRDALVTDLEESGIEPRPFWRPLHTQGPYRRDPDAFGNATWVCDRGLWLPSALSLTHEDVARVGGAVRRYAERHAAVAPA
jgi:perosamine synthetase